MVVQRTLILIKPDGVVRSLVGKIISRFEDTGLKITGMKMICADDELAINHYQLDETWAKKLFARTKETKEKEGHDFPFNDHMEYGELLQGRNREFLKEGPVVAIILEGPHAIEIIRKMVGHTEPRQASPGTIRGDLATTESYELSDGKERVLRNLVHASDSIETADREINLWFKKSEIQLYTKELDKHL